MISILLIRDPTTGWGSIDYTSFSSIFDVATPYVPPDSNSSSSSSDLSPGMIAGIVFGLLGGVALLFFVYSCFCRSQPSPQPQSLPIPAIAVVIPPPQGRSQLPHTTVSQPQVTANPLYPKKENNKF